MKPRQMAKARAEATGIKGLSDCGKHSIKAKCRELAAYFAGDLGELTLWH